MTAHRRSAARVVEVPGDDDRLWSVERTADYLGVPVGTIYQWRSRRKGPRGFRVGRFVRFDPAEVRRWLEDQVA